MKGQHGLCLLLDFARLDWFTNLAQLVQLAACSLINRFSDKQIFYYEELDDLA